MVRLNPVITSSVAQARQTLGLTQKELAHSVGVSRQTIVEMEAGGYNPSVVLALRLAILLETSVEELFMLPATEVAALQGASERLKTDSKDGSS